MTPTAPRAPGRSLPPGEGGSCRSARANLSFAPLGRRCPEEADEGRSDGRASQRWSLIRGAAA